MCVQMVKMFPKSGVPELHTGPTTFGRNLEPAYLDARCRALDEYLQALLDIPEVWTRTFNAICRTDYFTNFNFCDNSLYEKDWRCRKR